MACPILCNTVATRPRGKGCGRWSAATVDKEAKGFDADISKGGGGAAAELAWLKAEGGSDELASVKVREDSMDGKNEVKDNQSDGVGLEEATRCHGGEGFAVKTKRLSPSKCKEVEFQKLQMCRRMLHQPRRLTSSECKEVEFLKLLKCAEMWSYAHRLHQNVHIKEVPGFVKGRDSACGIKNKTIILELGIGSWK
jgi:hypothetical protein